jgi:uncharacterized protein (UPF0332 family)
LTPEAARFLDKARRLLAEAEAMLGIGLVDAAGRTAYLAGFHAAQALIFERTGRAVRTHRGAQAEFLRLTHGDPRLDPGLRVFLSQSYSLKAIADYETGPGAEVPPERAEAAVETGGHFVARVADLLSGPPAAAESA